MLDIANEILFGINVLAFLFYLKAGAWSGPPSGLWQYPAIITGASLAQLGIGTWQHNHITVAIFIFSSLIWAVITWIEWRNRKKRKRKRLLARAGYKGRAALRKLVKSMPRPQLPRIRVPAPAPG